GLADRAEPARLWRIVGLVELALVLRGRPAPGDDGHRRQRPKRQPEPDRQALHREVPGEARRDLADIDLAHGWLRGSLLANPRTGAAVPAQLASPLEAARPMVL